MNNNLSNQDSFSVQSDNYAKYRPHYPATLFAELASLCASKQRALDCATGNGQSAIALTKHFKEVIATDVSQQQIAQAITHPQVSYLVVAAEKLDFPAAYFDLITVAQAIHWFNLPEFYQKVKYIGKPGAIIAAWAYDLFKINNQIDEIIQDILLKPIEAFWAEGNKLISAKYQSIDFPFTEISLPTFQLQVEWNLAQLL
ncbi:MAG: class I SAM-dependent methyltransferase, partial [Cyanobacteria bacterium J083]